MSARHSPFTCFSAGLLAVFSGLHATPPALGQTLAGTHWQIAEIDGQRLEGAERRKTSLRLDDTASRFAASAGCNRIMGGYKLDGGQIRFGAAAMTRMACPGLAGEREKAFVAALAKVRAVEVTSGMMTLSDGNGVPLIRLFAAQK
ncbi:MAG: META domain-containing protein [Beijerinckiaceae bacterium]